MANDLLYKYKTSNILVKLIAINVLVFIVFAFGEFIFGVRGTTGTVRSWFMLPTELGSFILQPWSIISYAFLHNGFWHLLWNMLFLHWFGNYVLNLFTPKRVLTLYFLGAIFGGLLYIIAYNLFPVFDQNRGLMQGASAAVYAVMIFIATYTPNAQMRIFTFNIKLWYIAVFFVLKDFVMLTTGNPEQNNAGGLIAHLGGAIFGYVYATQLLKGKDIGIWFETIMDQVVSWFTPRKKKPFKKVHRSAKPYTKPANSSVDKDSKQQKIDAILDKIGKSGYDSLSKAEKDFLFKAGNDNNT